MRPDGQTLAYRHSRRVRSCSGRMSCRLSGSKQGRPRSFDWLLPAVQELLSRVTSGLYRVYVAFVFVVLA